MNRGMNRSTARRLQDHPGDLRSDGIRIHAPKRSPRDIFQTRLKSAAAHRLKAAGDPTRRVRKERTDSARRITDRHAEQRFFFRMTIAAGRPDRLIKDRLQRKIQKVIDDGRRREVGTLATTTRAGAIICARIQRSRIERRDPLQWIIRARAAGRMIYQPRHGIRRTPASGSVAGQEVSGTAQQAHARMVDRRGFGPKISGVTFAATCRIIGDDGRNCFVKDHLK